MIGMTRRGESTKETSEPANQWSPDKALPHDPGRYSVTHENLAFMRIVMRQHFPEKANGHAPGAPQPVQRCVESTSGLPCLPGKRSLHDEQPSSSGFFTGCADSRDPANPPDSA